MRRIRIRPHTTQDPRAQHVRRLRRRREIRQLRHDKACLRERLRTLRATSGEMRLQRRPLIRVERAEGVRLDQLPELVVFAHDAVCNPSFNRNKPFLIQLFTVPSGSCSDSAISLWLSPSKYAISIAFFWGALNVPISERTRSARRFSSSAFS